MSQNEHHTEGQWEIVPLSGVAGPYAIRMSSTLAGKTHYGVHGVGTLANARLIAAAPQMLAALREIASQIRNLPRSATADLIDKVARAAIAETQA